MIALQGICGIHLPHIGCWIYL